MKRSLIALAYLAAVGAAAQVTTGAKSAIRGISHLDPRPERPRHMSTGLPGLGYGTKVRGNRNVKRAAVKARNVKRHRANCRRAAS